MFLLKNFEEEDDMKNICIFFLTFFLFLWTSTIVHGSVNTMSYTLEINGQQIKNVDKEYNVNGSLFLPTRYTAEILGIEHVYWNKAKKEIKITIAGINIVFNVGSKMARINGNIYTIPSQVFIKGGNSFIPFRFVAEALGYEIEWNNKYNILQLFNDQIFVSEAWIQDEVYSEEDVYWLSRIIEAEAKNEPYEGKLAVGNVIMNRKKSSTFPNTIKEVIFDRQYGIQFTPTVNGSIYNIPSVDSIRAAKNALQGMNNIGKCLYFQNPRIAKSNWVAKNRTYYERIANHDFYN